jgi:lysophospholipase L1-like esterase
MKLLNWRGIAVSVVATALALALGAPAAEIYLRRLDGYVIQSWPLKVVTPPAINDPRKVYNARYVERNPQLFTNTTFSTFDPVVEFGEDVDRPAYLFARNWGDTDGWSTDQYGFRGFRRPDTKNAQTVRIFVLGGSTTEGTQGNRETWPYYLEQELSRRCPGKDVQVFNAGFHGLNSYDLLSIYLHRIRALKPDLLIYYEVGNGINEWESFVIERSRKGFFPVSRFYWHDFLNAHSASYRRLLRALQLPYPPAQYRRKSEPAPSREWYLSAVQSIIQSAQADGRPILLVSPVNGYQEGLWTAERIGADVYWLYERFNPLLPPDLDWWYDQLADGLMSLAKEQSVPYLDIRDRFPTTREYYATHGTLYDPGHYSPKGNQKLAELVADGMMGQALSSTVCNGSAVGKP